MAGIQRARYTIIEAPLAGDWGHKVACEKFGADLVESFPRLSRGPRAGALKGYLYAIKVEVGGWAHNAPGMPLGGGVLRPGTRDWCLRMVGGDSDPKGHSVVARWTRAGGAEVIQTPAEAEALFKAYGKEARYG